MAAMKAQTYRRMREIAAVVYTHATGNRRSPQYFEYRKTNKDLLQSHSAHLHRALSAIFVCTQPPNQSFKHCGRSSPAF
jgi:hypothetical protein